MGKNSRKASAAKPLSVLTRIILASTKPNAWILDPFAGSSTTGIAANLLNRRFVGIDSEENYLKLSECRKIEIESPEIQKQFLEKMNGFNRKDELTMYLHQEKEKLKKKV